MTQQGGGNMNLYPNQNLMEKGERDNGMQQDAAAVPIWKYVLLASIAAGIQFGWALQLSLLTPYVQMLGLPHAASSFIWLCGPISGLLVQPIVGYFSDRSKSQFGKRRPYIMSGAILVAAAVILIGFSADIGHSAGDDMTKSTKPRAVVVYVIGFWVLDVANNMLQGPCRALLADLSAGDEKKMGNAMTFFSFFMGVGNVAGYGLGSLGSLHKFLPFAQNHVCQAFCANLKTAFLIHLCLLLCLTFIATSLVKEPPVTVVVDDERKNAGALAAFVDLYGALKNLSKEMWILMLVTCLNWIGWFPFLLYDTDWMGREVYGGKVNESVYDMGVRAGAIGLLLNSVVLGITSVLLYFFAKGAKGARNWWVGANMVLALGLILTVPVSHYAKTHRVFGANHEALPPSGKVKAFALGVFALLGVPLSVTFTVPFALAAIYCSRNTGGAGQGLSLGVMNLAIVIPQIIVSLTSGPLDAKLGGGNLPAFLILGVTGAFLSGGIAYIFLPTSKVENGVNTTFVVGGGGH